MRSRDDALRTEFDRPIRFGTKADVAMTSAIGTSMLNAEQVPALSPIAALASNVHNTIVTAIREAVTAEISSKLGRPCLAGPGRGRSVRG